MASHNKDANIYNAAVGGNGYGGTVNMGPTATAPAKLESPMVTQHAEQYTSSYTAYPAPHRRPPSPYMRPQKPPPYYGGDDGYWGEAAGAYGGGYYGYRPPQPPPYGGGGGGYGYYPPSELGWRAGGGGYSYYDRGYGGGGCGGGDSYGGGGGYGGGGYGGGGGGYGRPPPHVGTGWLAAAGAAAYGPYQHHMRKHHQGQGQGQGHGHGHGGDGCSCGGGCSHGSCAAIHGEFEHEHHTKFKHSTAHHDGMCSENIDGPVPHVTVLEKRTTQVVQD